MDFTPASQNGVLPPTEYKTLDSDFRILVSTTSTYGGRPVLIKAISNAAMYKTVPVTFYSAFTSFDGSTSTVQVLGTSSYTDNIQAVLMTTDLMTGTNNIYAIWPGENRYAGKSTELAPALTLINTGTNIHYEFSATIAPPSGLAVVGEDDLYVQTHFNTSTTITGIISFYADNIQLSTATLYHNSATTIISKDYLPAGNHVIEVIWPGYTINGINYEGITERIPYTVARGRTLNSTMTFTVVETSFVSYEGLLTLNAGFNTMIPLGGNMIFYDGTTTIASSPLINNTTSVTIVNPLSSGTHQITAFWDGNQNSHPRYIEVASTQTIFMYSHGTIPSISLSITPNPAVYGYDNTQFVATLNTTTGVVGVVDFYRNNVAFGEGTIINNVATYIAPTTQFTTGTYTITAVYPGSDIIPKYFSQTSSPISYSVINKARTPITLTSNRNPCYEFTDFTLTLHAQDNRVSTGTIVVYDNSSSHVIGTTGFNGSNTAVITIDPTILDGTNGNTHNLFATWAGQFGNPLVPFLGTNSNVLVETITPASMTLVSNSYTNVTTLPTILTAAINSSTINHARTVQLLDGSTVISTATISSNAVTFTLSSGTVSVGTHQYKTQITGIYPGVVSNTISVGMLAPQPIGMAISVNPPLWQGYNPNGTTNTSYVTATIVVSSVYPGHQPTGSLTLYATSSTRSTVTSITINGTGTYKISWNPFDAGEIVDTDYTINAVYGGDSWNTLTTSSGVAFYVRRNIEPLLIVSYENTPATYGGVGYWNSAIGGIARFQPITISAVKSTGYNLTGPVTFYIANTSTNIYGSSSTISTASFIGDKASIVITPPVGKYFAAAKYFGDPQHESTTSNTINYTIVPAPNQYNLTSNIINNYNVVINSGTVYPAYSTLDVINFIANPISNPTPNNPLNTPWIFYQNYKTPRTFSIIDGGLLLGSGVMTDTATHAISIGVQDNNLGIRTTYASSPADTDMAAIRSSNYQIYVGTKSLTYISTNFASTVTYSQFNSQGSTITNAFTDIYPIGGGWGGYNYCRLANPNATLGDDGIAQVIQSNWTPYFYPYDPNPINLELTEIFYKPPIPTYGNLFYGLHAINSSTITVTGANVKEGFLGADLTYQALSYQSTLNTLQSQGSFRISNTSGYYTTASFMAVNSGGPLGVYVTNNNSYTFSPFDRRYVHKSNGGYVTGPLKFVVQFQGNSLNYPSSTATITIDNQWFAAAKWTNSDCEVYAKNWLGSSGDGYSGQDGLGGTGSGITTVYPCPDQNFIYKNSLGKTIKNKIGLDTYTFSIDGISPNKDLVLAPYIPYVFIGPSYNPEDLYVAYSVVDFYRSRDAFDFSGYDYGNLAANEYWNNSRPDFGPIGIKTHPSKIWITNNTLTNTSTTVTGGIDYKPYTYNGSHRYMINTGTCTLTIGDQNSLAANDIYLIIIRYDDSTNTSNPVQIVTSVKADLLAGRLPRINTIGTTATIHWSDTIDMNITRTNNNNNNNITGRYFVMFMAANSLGSLTYDTLSYTNFNFTIQSQSFI